MSSQLPRSPRLHWQPVVYALFSVLLHQCTAFVCHPKCNCIWRNGKQTAECLGQGFEKIPSGLDTGIQVVNLSRNNFRHLPANAFVLVGLVNLQRIYLSKCSIEQVDEYAFNRTSNLIELDLSNNRLTQVPSTALRHLPLLRNLILSANPITVVATSAFVELKALTGLELSHCKIDSIALGAFEGLEKLQVLKLDGNNLQTVPGKAMLPLKMLQGITVDENPWRCDCHLRSFRQWLDKHNVPYVPPGCVKPVRLKGREWNEVDILDYACEPTILNTSTVINVVEGSNVTLNCRVTGDPVPEIQWLWRERVISNLSEGISSQQTFIVREVVENDKLSQLSITSVQEPNAGSYICIAENTAGRMRRNFTLQVSRILTDVGTVEREKTQEVKEEEKEQVEDRSNPVIGLIIGIVIGALIVLIIFGVVLWVCRRRRRGAAHRKRTDANHKLANSVIPHSTKETAEDVDLKLLRVNPVEKPPRLGAYEGVPTSELDHYDPLQVEGGLSPHVWVVKYHIPPEMEWEEEQKQLHSGEKRLSTRGPIPVPMPLPPEDIHSRLHTELTDTLRRKGDSKKIMERERGDGSSELEAVDYEGNKPNFETLRVRELEKSLRGPVEHSPIADKSPDLIDHTRKPTEHPVEDIGEVQWKTSGAGPKVWETSYDHPTAYYRNDVQSKPTYEGGIDGTEV